MKFNLQTLQSPKLSWNPAQKIGIAILFFMMGLQFNANSTTISVIKQFAALDLSDGLLDSVYNVPDDLIITTTGGISGNVNGASQKALKMTINVKGSILLEGNGSSGARITSIQTGGSCSGGRGGDITLLAGSFITQQAGSVISSNAVCSAGAIYIQACGAVSIGGLVESRSTLSGVGATQPPGGGQITIIGTCELTIQNTAKVSSQGQDPGADLVHLEANEVKIFGLVQSTGVGHGVPNKPKTHLVPPYRPEKPANSTAGVEVWACTILIDKILPNRGEINADLTTGALSRNWIDLFARKDITINGCGPGPQYCVHANNSGNTPIGGIITVRAVTGFFKSCGLAIQANASTSGGSGGSISIHAKLDVNLANGTILQAVGSTNSTSSHGGKVEIQAFGPPASNIATVANDNINVTGGRTPDGSVKLTACGTIGFPPGTITPSSIVASKTVNCGGDPAIFPGDSLPDCGLGVSCSITGNPLICDGSYTELCGPVDGISYVWSTTETDQCIMVSEAGTYSVSAPIANGCELNCSVTTTIQPLPPCTIEYFGPPPPVCDQELIMLCAPIGPYTYLWSNADDQPCTFDNPLATNSPYDYSVLVTDANNCFSECHLPWLDIINCPPPRLRDPNASDSDNIFVNAYPNPFSSSVIIEFGKNNATRVLVEIYSLAGDKNQTLFDGQVDAGITYQRELRGDNLAPGIYVVRILSDNEDIRKKLVLIK